MQATTKAGHGALVRLVWLVLGAFFALLTARVLLWEVHSVSDLTADHLLTIGAIVGAIAAGHFFWHMLWGCKFGAALGLGIAFAAATTYCLIGSAGRGDEVAFEKNAAARQINEDRERYQRDRTEAKSRYQAAMDAETAECNSGQGSKCIAKRATTSERRTDFEVADLLVRQAKSEQRENGKLKRAAELISFFGRVEQATAEKGLALVWPFIPPLVCELLTIVFLHLAFAVMVPRRRRDRPANGTVADSPTPGPGTVQPSHGTVPPAAETVVPAGRLRHDVVVPFRRPAKPVAAVETDVLAYVRERLNAGETLPSQATIAKRFRLPKQTVSRWMAKWETAGLISRTRDGRCTVIRKAAIDSKLLQCL